MYDVSVLVDGMTSRPQLDHPEGVVTAPDGTVYCGGESGQVYRVDAEAGTFSVIAETGGFSLGLAWFRDELLVCDLRGRCVHAISPRDGTARLFTTGGPEGLTTPNAIAAVSDDLVILTDTGAAPDVAGRVLTCDAGGAVIDIHRGPFVVPNGIAVDAGRRCAWLVETFRPSITRLPLTGDGTIGTPEVIARPDGCYPDGVVVGPDGLLYVGCYEPSRVLRVDPDSGRWEIIAEDPSAHVLCHPTNLAVLGADLITANLGRWHLSRITGVFADDQPQSGLSALPGM